MLQADIGVGSVDPWLETVAYASGVTILAIILIAWKALQYSGLDEQQRRQIRAVRGELLRLTPTRVTVRRDKGFEASTPTLASILSRSATVDETDPAGDTTLRAAVADLMNETREATPDVPAIAVRGAIEGVLVLVIGSVLFVSASRWEQAAETTSASPIEMVSGMGAAGINILVETAVMAPVFETTTVLFAFAVLAGEWIFNQWLLVGISLLVGAAAVTYPEYATHDQLSADLYDHRELVAGVVIILPSLWVVSAIPYLLGHTIGFATVGWAVSMLFSVILIGGIGILFADDLDRRLYAHASDVVLRSESLTNDSIDWIKAYMFVRRLFWLAALLTIPLLAAYIGLAATTGAAVEVAGVLVSAPLPTQLALLAAGVGLLALFYSQFPNASDRVAEAFVRASRSQAIRSWMFARGVPITAMALAFALTWTLIGTRAIGDVTVVSALISVWPPLVAAIAVGVVARSLTLAWERVKYRIFGGESNNGKAAVTVDVFPAVTDASDEPVYICRVDGHTLAHRSRDRLLEDAERVAKWHFTDEADSTIHVGGGGGPPTTESRYYYEELKTGRVDLGSVRKALRGDVRSRIEASFRDEREVDVEDLERELDQDYPEYAWRTALRELQKSADISRRDDRYIRHGG